MSWAKAFFYLTAAEDSRVPSAGLYLFFCSSTSLEVKFLLMSWICCVPGCKTNSFESTMAMFPFPKDHILRDKWRRAIGRRDLVPSDVICEKHFAPIFFENSGGERPKLSGNAIPSVIPDYLKCLSWQNTQRQSCRKTVYRQPKVKDRMLIDNRRPSEQTKKRDSEEEFQSGHDQNGRKESCCVKEEINEPLCEGRMQQSTLRVLYSSTEEQQSDVLKREIKEDFEVSEEFYDYNGEDMVKCTEHVKDEPFGMRQESIKPWRELSAITAELQEKAPDLKLVYERDKRGEKRSAPYQPFSSDTKKLQVECVGGEVEDEPEKNRHFNEFSNEYRCGRGQKAKIQEGIDHQTSELSNMDQSGAAQSRLESSASTRRAIVELYRANIKKIRIAELLNLSRSTVNCWLKRYTKGVGLKNQPRSGRPRCTTQEQDKLIIDAVYQQPITSSTIGKLATQLQLSRCTIRRRLQEFGLKYEKSAMRPFLWQSHKEQRLGFALHHLPMKEQFWETIIWCDRKTFCSDSKGRLHRWRPARSRSEEKYALPCCQSGVVSVDLWGWMSSCGPGELVPIHERLNSQQYVEILEEVMIPTVRALLLPAPLPIYVAMQNLLRQDSYIVKKWFQGHPEVIRIDLPVKSRDLNPFENLWGIMVKKWVGEVCNTKEALVSHFMSEWDSLRGSNICEKLVESVPRRLNAVIDNLGSHINISSEL
ncbi:uncharacterized protein [Palaemon carinicauda]|uniref:uncharacterized protein isoform X2 n=1 Tax=Palaemon carinicauda TaxID=392227 RepID=UPI0035B5EA4B